MSKRTLIKAKCYARQDKLPEAIAAPECSRNFYPYPTVERDNNANTPADPPV